ncbi:GNAT family N-acetyltransferase [Methylocaldum sp. BRCS4]|jgi:GNAT superfamily N-acetyltransferase|uniref:GNAT family N-acetyltransferase n=1 Tax=Methylocaldum sp. GT1BB TaxID=3438963 RepID=UPI0012EB6F19|nr:GNAT family N-acetyltransferase [Methylocaldum sp. BRCS4]
MNMVYIREKLATDNGSVADIVALATADLRSVYRRARSAATSPTPDNEDSPLSLVAVEGETIVGVVEYCVRSESLYIRGLAVHPQQRKRGIARQLIRAVEDIAIRGRKQKVTLSTIKETGNPEIFVQLGFSVVDESPAEGFEGLNGKQVTKVDMYRELA